MAVNVVDPRERYAGWVAPLCWLAVALEGFDLVVLGVVLPSLLADKAWGLTPNTASLVSVVGLLGVMVGALALTVTGIALATMTPAQLRALRPPKRKRPTDMRGQNGPERPAPASPAHATEAAEAKGRLGRRPRTRQRG